MIPDIDSRIAFSGIPIKYLIYTRLMSFLYYSMLSQVLPTLLITSDFNLLHVTVLSEVLNVLNLSIFDAAALFFLTYDGIKRNILPKVSPQHYPFVYMFGAAAAEVVACIIRVPVEVIKQRKQTSKGNPTAINLLKYSYLHEGLFKVGLQIAMKFCCSITVWCILGRI